MSNKHPEAVAENRPSPNLVSESDELPSPRLFRTSLTVAHRLRLVATRTRHSPIASHHVQSEDSCSGFKAACRGSMDSKGRVVNPLLLLSGPEGPEPALGFFEKKPRIVPLWSFCSKAKQQKFFAQQARGSRERFFFLFFVFVFVIVYVTLT